MNRQYHEIQDIKELQELLASNERIERCVFQDVDFTVFTGLPYTNRFYDCLFMGCTFSKQMRVQIDKSCFIFSHIDVPYNCFRNHLYTADTLYRGYRLGEPESYECCFDNTIYQYYLQKGKTTIFNLKGVAPDIQQIIVRRLGTMMFELRKADRVPPMPLGSRVPSTYCITEGERPVV